MTPTGSRGEVEWAVARASDDGLTLHVVYAGSSSITADRARVTETGESVTVVLETPKRGGKLDLRWKCASVPLAEPLGERAVLGASERLLGSPQSPPRATVEALIAACHPVARV